MARLIGVTSRGCRVGQDHPKARLSNADLDLLLALRDEGMGYNELAAKFEVPKSSVAAWCKSTRRNTTPDRFVAPKG